MSARLSCSQDLGALRSSLGVYGIWYGSNPTPSFRVSFLSLGFGKPATAAQEVSLRLVP